MRARAEPILIVEDDPDARLACAELLRMDGYEVETAADGMEALFKVKARKPQLVLLDLALPTLDGFYVADLWRSEPIMRDVPVIVLSGFVDAHNERLALEAGCAMVLAKPCSADELRNAVQSVLRRAPAA